MSLVRMAFRNLGRKRSRTALSILAVAMGVFVVIMVKSFVEGMVDGILGHTIRFSTGHVRLIDREYRVKERLLSLNYPVDGFAGEGYEALVQEIEALDQVDYVVPRLRFGAMVAGKEDAEGVQAVGIDPEVEDRLTHLSRYLAGGRLLAPDAREVVMGYRTLEKLGLQVGDKFTLVFTTAFGSMKGYTFTIVGSLRSGLAYLDDGLVFVPLPVAQEMLEMGAGVTELLVMGRNERRAKAMVAAVNELLVAKGAAQRYEAIPWYSSSGLVETIGMARVVYDFMYAFILFLASFVVINTMVMVVNERRREIGMLSALGLRPDEIGKLFLYEGGIIGAIGSVAGVILGSLSVLILRQTGITVPGMDTMDARLFLTPKLYPDFSLNLILFALIAGIVVTMLAIAGPARRASKMKPTEALRA